MGLFQRSCGFYWEKMVRQPNKIGELGLGSSRDFLKAGKKWGAYPKSRQKSGKARKIYGEI